MTARLTTGAPDPESVAPTISDLAAPSVQTSLDRERGVLSLSLSSSQSSADATFDDDEVFIFRATKDGPVLGFEIPHFLTYWQDRIAELVQHLVAYAPQDRRAIELSLQEFGPEHSSGC